MQMKRVRGVINLIQPPGEGRAVPENTEPVEGRRVIGLHRMCASFLYYPVVFQGHSLGLENSLKKMLKKKLPDSREQQAIQLGTLPPPHGDGKL